MTLSDDRLRLAYGDALRNRARADRASCPEPEALLALAERTGPEAVRLAVLDHVMMCDQCRRELDLLRAGVSAVGVPKVRPWYRSPSLGLMAIAAVLLMFAGVRLFVASGDLESGPRLRGGSGIATYPVESVPGGGARLAWRPVVGVVSYRLEVLDAAGRAVVDSTMRDTSFVLADSLARSQSGLAWTVSAMLGDGSSASSLPAPVVIPPR